MKFKAIIFDMDGTIVDTSDIWVKATRELIASKGVTLTPEVEAQIGKGTHGLAVDKACKLIKELANIPDCVEALTKEKIRRAQDLYKTGIKFIDGFEQFHAAVNNFSLGSAVATNADDHTLEVTKRALQIEKFFGEHIYNISCVDNRCKPDPALYLYAAKQLGHEPKHCMAIEDSAHGIAAAQAAGIFCIGINTSKNFEQVKNADLIVDAYHEIDLKKLISY